MELSNLQLKLLTASNTNGTLKLLFLIQFAAYCVADPKGMFVSPPAMQLWVEIHKRVVLFSKY